MVDVESDGPNPGDYSMICFGAVIVEEILGRTFYARLRPISDKWIPEALAVSGFTREQTMQFDLPLQGMQEFRRWLDANASGRLMFISDNNGYDWQFINWYFHHTISWAKIPLGIRQRIWDRFTKVWFEISPKTSSISERPRTRTTLLMTRKETLRRFWRSSAIMGSRSGFELGL